MGEYSIGSFTGKWTRYGGEIQINTEKETSMLTDGSNLFLSAISSEWIKIPQSWRISPGEKNPVFVIKVRLFELKLNHI